MNCLPVFLLSVAVNGRAKASGAATSRKRHHDGDGFGGQPASAWDIVAVTAATAPVNSVASARRDVRVIDRTWGLLVENVSAVAVRRLSFRFQIKKLLCRLRLAVHLHCLRLDFASSLFRNGTSVFSDSFCSQQRRHRPRVRHGAVDEVLVRLLDTIEVADGSPSVRRTA